MGLAAILLCRRRGGAHEQTTDGGGPGGAPGDRGEIEGFAFGPEALTVGAGATVTWTNLDGTARTVTQNGAVLDLPDLATDEMYAATFEEPGT